MDKKDDALTGLRKRQQISAANKTVFAWIISASIVIGICAVGAQFLVRQLFFNNKIYDAYAKTSSTLEKNIKAYDGLKSEVTKLVADPNLTALKKGDNSTPLQVIIDALPTEKNQAAFATSMQTEVIGPSGAALTSFEVTDNVATSTGTSSSTNSAQSFNCNFVITGTYAQVQQALKNMERSIRPITVNSVNIQGSASSMQATIGATTYYQPVKDIQLKEVQVKP